jgi:hypothetical protein
MVSLAERNLPMLRSLLLLLPALLVTGCHVPMPKFQPFAGSGSPRVPPPATGSYGKPDSYYNGGAPAGAQSSLTTEPAGQQQVAEGASNIMAQHNSAGTRQPGEKPVGTGTLAHSTTASHNQVGGASLPVAGASISRSSLTSPEDQPASYHSPVSFAASDRDSSTTTGGLVLNGMRINDATRTSEPQRFVPTGDVINITQLPRATAPSRPSGIRGFSQTGAAPSAGVIETPPQSATAATTSGSSTVELSADGWRSKYIPRGVGVASN